MRGERDSGNAPLLTGLSRPGIRKLCASARGREQPHRDHRPVLGPEPPPPAAPPRPCHPEPCLFPFCFAPLRHSRHGHTSVTVSLMCAGCTLRCGTLAEHSATAIQTGAGGEPTSSRRGVCEERAVWGRPRRVPPECWRRLQSHKGKRRGSGRVGNSDPGQKRPGVPTAVLPRLHGSSDPVVPSSCRPHTASRAWGTMVIPHLVTAEAPISPPTSACTSLPWGPEQGSLPLEILGDVTAQHKAAHGTPPSERKPRSFLSCPRSSRGYTTCPRSNS